MLKYWILPIFIGFIVSCSTKEEKKEFTEEEIATESAKANAIYQAYFDELLNRSPEFQTQLGIKKDYGQWDNIDDEYKAQTVRLKATYFQQLEDSINYAKLDPYAQLAYDNLAYMAKGVEDEIKYIQYDYPVNQMYGVHTSVISTFKSEHRIDSISDAKAYIERVNNITPYFDQLIRNLELREEKGIILPNFLLVKCIETCDNLTRELVSGNIENHLIYLDFEEKLENLHLEEEMRDGLMAQLNEALFTSFLPSYQKLIQFLTAQKERATSEEGAWKFPDGENYYKYRLNLINTTSITPDEVYELGLKEVERIHNEIKGIMKKLNFDGSVEEFLAYIRESEEFYYENTLENKEKLLDSIRLLVDNMWMKVDDYFNAKPEAALTVNAVEPYREKAAGYAFYQRPASDGTRPGMFYINLYDLKSVPIYDIESLTYHEAIPGHHFNIAIAQELEDIPMFMKFQSNTAHTEGWGLYSEFLAKEMGFYQNPYADFGRLNGELFRAVRLVVDAGIHFKKWDRQKSIDYYFSKTAASMRRCESMVDRHMVMPGQATAYKVGMNKILELRKKAETELGDQYDIKDFHDAILTKGILPLDLVEKLVNEYIASKKSIS